MSRSKSGGSTAIERRQEAAHNVPAASIVTIHRAVMVRRIEQMVRAQAQSISKADVERLRNRQPSGNQNTYGRIPKCNCQADHQHRNAPAGQSELEVAPLAHVPNSPASSRRDRLSEPPLQPGNVNYQTNAHERRRPPGNEFGTLPRPGEFI